MNHLLLFTDPLGFEHVVEVPSGAGIENLMHCYPVYQRDRMLDALFVQVAKSPQGQFNGYTWAPLTIDLGKK